MTFYKTIGIGLAATLLAMSAPSFAQDHAKMKHDQMDHSQMNHNDHDHNHSDMDKADMTVDPVAEGAPVIIAKVNGLVCDFCAQALKKVFKKEAAVETLNVDLDAGEVHIALKEAQTLSDDTVKDLIRKSGYSLVAINREGGA